MGINEGVTLAGVVTLRRCPTCGHHEVGFTAKDGRFYPLWPGTWIQVLEGHPTRGYGSEKSGAPLEEIRQETEAQSKFQYWAPDPVKGNRSLRLKYGVMMKGNLRDYQMNGEIFEAAYLEKLQHLIEREISTPLPVILDRFFSAPHLASGNPREIAHAMWQELEEIRQPVKLVQAWLENPSEECLKALIWPRSQADISADSASESELINEMEQLSLEEFLDLL